MGCQVALIGLPDDTGVRLNGGRPGAAEGPAAFRSALARFGVHEPAGWVYPKVFDAGDIIPAHGHDEDALLATHRRITEAVSAILELGLFPIAIGGGHDLTLPVVRAVARHHGPLAGVYFDPHLDVRAEVGSGMSFRRIVEECGTSSLDVFGFSPLVNAREHVEWFGSHGGTTHADGAGLSSALARPGQGGIFASFDMDVLDASHAPGVSAMNPAGWTVRESLEAAERCGACRDVRCFDIMELSPPHDEGGRTARAAAAIFLSFLKGWSQRSA